ncbi:putative bifunctional diguanylate cyclase/phosphodiesterase [Paenibacillus sp. CAU 1782]
MESAIDALGRMGACVRLNLAINHNQATGKRLLIALIDLDRFYRVNETRGTEFGNVVLSVASKRLNDAATHISGAVQAVIKRMEGNTFLAIVPVDEANSYYWGMVEMLKNTVERPVQDGAQELYLTASIGVSLYPQDGMGGEELLCRAESALYQAKEHGGNKALFYNPEHSNKLSRKLMLETGLRPALITGQFHLRYQPIVTIKDGSLRGYEALIRWNHPELGLVAPQEFIPIAEHNGLIVPIGEWVLREVCRMLSETGDQGLVMSLNVSTVQLLDPGFAATVLNTLEEFKISPSSIELEITESVICRSFELAVAVLSRLRAAGVRIALDDFGVGYSSYNTLKQLPFQCLKIDKTFVSQIDLLGAEHHIVESIIGLVRKLGMEVVAEGVEYEAQYHLLKEWGCHYVQGHLLGEPVVWEKNGLRRMEKKAFVHV